MRRALLLASALLLSSCSYLTEPTPPSLPLDYSAAAYEQVPAFAAEGRTGAVVVRDRYLTGVCHKTETRTASRSGSEVTLRVAHIRESLPQDVACIDLGKTGAFEATIGGLDAGTYRVRVEYVGDIRSETRPPAPTEATVTVQ